MSESNTKTAITIVIPAYNHELYIRDSIESIKNQSFPDWELIVIDDGSTDNTGEIADEYSADKKIQIIHQENRGLSASLNRGLKLAGGRYFGFLPSDDAFYTEKLDLQLEWLEARPDLAAVATHQTLIDHEGLTISDHPLVDWFNARPEGREDFILGLLERNFISAPSVLMRTDVLREIGGFDTECVYMQDYDLWFRLLKEHNMMMLQRPLVYYRWHGKNLTRKATPQSEEERARVLYKAAVSLEPQDIFPYLSESPRPEIVAECRSLLNERLYRNRSLNIEELQAVFDNKFRSLFERIQARSPEADGVLYPFLPESAIPFSPLNIMLEVTSLDQGGLEQVVHDLALGLQKKGNRAVVVCTERGGKIAERLKCQGIDIEILPATHKEEAYREILSRYEVDIVNTHYSFFGARLAAEAGLPVVSVIHNIYAWLDDNILGAFRTVDPFISHYIAVSDDVAGFMAHRFRVKKERITTVPNGLDVDAWQARKEHTSAQDREAFGFSPADYVFLTVAAINRTKGQDRIIKIFPELLEHCPDVKALFLGQVVDRQFHRYLLHLVHENGLEDKIIFAPHAPDAAPFYKMADAFVLPSVVEGWSMAMMEAMFFGLPLIMSAVGGARTVVAKDGLGLLIHPPYGELTNLGPHYQERYTMMAEDPALPELLNAMSHFCEERDKWKKTGVSGVSKVIDNYALSLTVTSYERIFWSVFACSRSHILKQVQGQIAEEKRKNMELKKALNASQSMIGRLVDFTHISAQLTDKEGQLREHESNISILRAEKDQLTRDLHAWEALVQTIYSSKAWRFVSAYRKTRQGLSRTVRRTGRKVIMDWGIDVPKMKRKVEDSASKAVNRARAAVSETNNITVSSTVNILTPSFFDREGNNMFFGGAERYLIDLTHLIRDWGYNAEIYQPATFPWIRYYRDIKVNGFVCGEEIEEIGEAFDQTIPKGSLTIYHAFYLTPATHSQSCPSIGISHGNYWDTSSFQASRANFERHVQRILNSIRQLNRLVCVDTNTINWLRAIDYYLSSKTTYIPNYVDLEQFKPSPLPEGEEIIICFPRRLYKPRGFYLLLENVDFLLSKYPNVQIHFVGKADRKEADIVNRLVKESYGRVQWYNCPPEEMYKVYERSHIVLVPTVSSEGTSFSCLEAMACGRAVIATDVGGLPNLIIDGYNGRMIPPRADALRSALVDIIESPSVQRDLGRKAREVVEKGYSKALWEKRWNKILADFLPEQKSISAKFQEPIVVYLHTPPIRWSFMQQRPQQLCLHMAEAGLRVFFYSDDKEDVRHSSGNLQILRSGDDLYPDCPVLYIHYPFNYPKIREYSDPLVLYDVLDDINIYSGSMLEEAVSFHDRLMKEADIVVCSSRRLLEKLRMERDDVVLVPNAVRPQDFENVNIQTPDDLLHILRRGRPIVGYVGAFGAWFDFELYNEVTKKAEDLSFILIGPDYMRNIQKIARRKNVAWLGAKPYEVLPGYYAHMDVGIIPFMPSEVTHCTSPIKLFEYMASGKPVVTTDLAECRAYSPVFRASSAEDFVNCLRTAVEKGKTSDYQSKIAKVVKENTWAMRAEVLNDLIQRAWKRKHGGEKREAHEHKIMA
jgi:glycosyltransferase involved in cell wall biosynthesis